jgi:hypothetical protein
MNATKVAKNFAKGNVIVFGTKGKGKDVLFQKVINKRKKIPYYSNLTYGYKHNKVNLIDMNVDPNDFENLISNNVNKIPITFKQKHDFYISDGGIYLPSHFDGLLTKYYKSMPVLYAVIRHLYDSNIHINTQALNRVWIKLREQADYYYKALYTFKFFGLLITKVRYFETYKGASENMLPFNRKLLNGHNNALKEQHKATFGDIKNFFIVSKIKHLQYDSRYFYSMFFKEYLPKKEKVYIRLLKKFICLFNKLKIKILKMKK